MRMIGRHEQAPTKRHDERENEADRDPERGDAGLSKQRLLQPAVDDDRLSRDVARAVGGEEAHDVAELARRAPAAQRDLLELLGRRAAGIELVEARRGDAAGRDAVDRDALRADLAAQRLEPADERGTERVREREVRRRLEGRERADRDDPAAGALLQVRQRVRGRASRRGGGGGGTRRRATPGSASSAPPGGGPPPFQTRTSRPPKRSTAVATARSRSASSVTSPATATPPSRAACSSSSSARRAKRTTFAPSSASASALASPSPDEAPQTSAVRPLSPRSTTRHVNGVVVACPYDLSRS